MFPSQGSRNSIAVTYAGGFLQGDSQFTRYGATSFWFFPLPWDTVFSVGGRWGYITANNDKPIPVYERYYLGGINSLRGLRNVGPHRPGHRRVHRRPYDDELHGGIYLPRYEERGD